MVPSRQGHSGQLKLVLDQLALFCRNPLPLLLPPAFLAPPTILRRIHASQKALKTNGVKTRAAERKELTCQQADLHASSLINQAQAILSFSAPTPVNEGDVFSSGWVNIALIFRLFVLSNLVTYLIFYAPKIHG
jgi:hypothetical protein